MFTLISDARIIRLEKNIKKRFRLKLKRNIYFKKQKKLWNSITSETNGGKNDDRRTCEHRTESCAFVCMCVCVKAIRKLNEAHAVWIELAGNQTNSKP